MKLFSLKVTTGAHNDLEKAFDIAYSLVTKFGMSEKIGYMGLPQENYYKKVSENTQKASLFTKLYFK
jgi:AFG3 family protein